MSWKDKSWKYATALVVLLLLLNPEAIGMAFFIDAVGLEVFLLLLEMQLLLILGSLFTNRLKPLFDYSKKACLALLPLASFKVVSSDPGKLLLIVPGPSMLMNIFVVLSLAGILFGIH